MALEQAGMIAAGLGCRRGASAEEIIAVVHLALSEAGLSADALSGLFAPAFKQAETGLAEAAAALNLPLVLIPDALMQAAQARTVTQSDRVVALVGYGSVAEAAALCGAGPNARLVLPRLAKGGVTCALAAT